MTKSNSVYTIAITGASVNAPGIDADLEQIKTFYKTLFKHADPNTFINFRAFDQHNRDKPPLFIHAFRLGEVLTGQHDEVIKGLTKRAARENAVLAPPVCTFKNASDATTANVADAVSVSVDLDVGDIEAKRDLLISLMGEPTIQTASGSVLIDPETGQVQDKVHLHWRTATAATAPEDHLKVRAVRRLAAQIAEGDMTGVAVVHPFRLPGSLNVKNVPVMSRIITCNPDSQIDLDATLASLIAHTGDGYEESQPNFRAFDGIPQAPIETIRELLKTIPNLKVDRSLWHTIGMAVFVASGGSAEGLEAWREWSEKLRPRSNNCVSCWNNLFGCPPTTVGIHTLKWHAAQTPRGQAEKLARDYLEEAESDISIESLRGYLVGRGGEVGAWAYSDIADNNSLIIDGFFREKPLDVSAAFAAFPLNPADDATEFSDGSSALDKFRARGRTPDQLTLNTDCRYLMKGVMHVGQLGAILGQPGMGKSVITPYIAYKIGLGQDVFGRRTKSTRVLYLAGEDALGLKNRVISLYTQYGNNPNFTLFPIGNLLNPLERDSLAAMVAADDYGLVIIDTLGSAWAGFDENSSSGMGEVIRFCREDLMGGQSKRSVILVHHLTKSGEGGARGHSVLNGTLDFAITLELDLKTKIVKTSMGKNKAGPADFYKTFQIKPFVLGQDDDGDDITAPIAEEISAIEVAVAKAEVKAETPEAKQSVGGQAFVLALIAKLKFANEDALWESCKSAMTDEHNKDSVRDCFKRSLRKLKSLNHIRIDEDGNYSIHQPIVTDMNFPISDEEAEMAELLK